MAKYIDGLPGIGIPFMSYDGMTLKEAVEKDMAIQYSWESYNKIRWIRDQYLKREVRRDGFSWSLPENKTLIQDLEKEAETMVFDNTKHQDFGS